jgi:protease I
MEPRMSEQPATDAGTTRPAGAGLSNDDMADQVGDQTSSDLEAEDVFSRETQGAATDTEAAKAAGTELA